MLPSLGFVNMYAIFTDGCLPGLYSYMIQAENLRDLITIQYTVRHCFQWYIWQKTGNNIYIKFSQELFWTEVVLVVSGTVQLQGYCILNTYLVFMYMLNYL
jgi:hypothetical protein